MCASTCSPSVVPFQQSSHFLRNCHCDDTGVHALETIISPIGGIYNFRTLLNSSARSQGSHIREHLQALIRQRASQNALHVTCAKTRQFLTDTNPVWMKPSR
ncbi:hypothetical protein EmuJ_000967200 [Echinococcus multilocularis]|uniref:Uncharacterized protein n=1 Tax=Echinococcus multilocularis TaxID=6211 RepID=A0A068YBU3_ECHMU|nr:hypothetical protein EmuJ_000967200 [Echinococcus multilocularis]